MNAALLHVIAVNPTLGDFVKILHFIIHIARAIWPLIRQGVSFAFHKGNITPRSLMHLIMHSRDIYQRFCTDKPAR